MSKEGSRFWRSILTLRNWPDTSLWRSGSPSVSCSYSSPSLICYATPTHCPGPFYSQLTGSADLQVRTASSASMNSHTTSALRNLSTIDSFPLSQTFRSEYLTPLLFSHTTNYITSSSVTRCMTPTCQRIWKQCFFQTSWVRLFLPLSKSFSTRSDLCLSLRLSLHRSIC